MIEVVAFAGALAHAGEHRIAAMRLGDVVDQFLDQHGLADAGAAEQANLAALGVRREQIDDLDAGDENLRFRRLLDKGRRGRVDRAALIALDRPGLVHRLADDVHDAAERFLADRHGDHVAGVDDFLAANQAIGGVHRDRADGVFAQMLRHFQDEPIALVLRFEGVKDGGQMAAELHVHNGAGYLAHPADRFFLVPSNSSCRLLALSGARTAPLPKLTLKHRNRSERT